MNVVVVMMRRWIAIGLLLAPCLCASAQAKWQIGPWVRASEQPVIQPSDATFTDPVSGKLTHWEKLHTFNPAAVVRNGNPVLLTGAGAPIELAEAWASCRGEAVAVGYVAQGQFKPTRVILVGQGSHSD